MKETYTFTSPEDIRDYFATDPDMLEAYEAGEFVRLVVTVDHQKKTAEYTIVNEYHDAPAQEDDYEGVIEFLHSHV